MFLNMQRRYLYEVIKTLGFIKREQAEKLLLAKYPSSDFLLTVNGLKSSALVREYSGYLLERGEEISEDIRIATELMMKITDGKIENVQKGVFPFTVTFFRSRADRLWRYDICIVPNGREAVVSAALEGMYAKYRVVVFVLEDPEQQKDLYVSCDYCFVWKEDGEYHFFKEEKQNE